MLSSSFLIKIQMVYFFDNKEISNVLRNKNHETTLMTWFSLNYNAQYDQYLYHEIPKFLT